MLGSLEPVRYKSSSPSERVVELIISQIASKKVRPGEKLPPIREFGKAIGVGNYSVRQAISKLTKEGVLDTVRGSGTYVRNQANVSHSGRQAHKTRTFCVIAAFCHEDIQIKLSHPVTVASILDECKNLNAQGRLLSPNIDILSLEEILSEITDRSYDGVIWLYPTSEHWPIVKALHKQGIPIAITSHSSYPVDVPAVQGNEVGAAYQIGQQLARESYRKVVLLSAEEQAGGNVRDVRSGLHIGMKIGLLNAYEEAGAPSPELVFIKYGQDNYIEKLTEAVAGLDAHTCLMIANTMEFRSYFQKDPDRVTAMLQGKKLIISSSQQEYQSLSGLAEKVEFSVQVYPYERIGRAVVHKLNNGIDGNFNDTVTLVNGVFKKYEAVCGQTAIEQISANDRQKRN